MPTLYRMLDICEDFPHAITYSKGYTRWAESEDRSYMTARARGHGWMTLHGLHHTVTIENLKIYSNEDEELYQWMLDNIKHPFGVWYLLDRFIDIYLANEEEALMLKLAWGNAQLNTLKVS